MALRQAASRSLRTLLNSGRGIQTSAALCVSAQELTKSVPQKLLIGGEFVPSQSGKTFDVIDPRTEEVVFKMAQSGKEDVDRAVRVARKAFDEGPWPRMTAKQRSRILMKFADLMEAHADELAALESLDNGKPLYMSKIADIPLTIDHFRYYAGWSDKITGRTIPCDGPYFGYTLHEPLGVVGQIIPWNFPLLMLAWKVAPALACGNTVVLKPAEQTPLTAMRVGQLALEAGIPEGVFNILPGFGDAGAALASHPLVDKVAFTGSTEVGKLVGKAAAENIKPVSLELGGKSPTIVWKDVDVDEAVENAHFALFFNHGQCCAAGSRLYVHDAIYDEFVDKAAARAKTRKVGDPFQEGIEQGPQVDADQFSKIMGYIDAGHREGAKLVAGGGRHGSKGYYIEPTVFANATDDMKIAQEEIFGPVQTIMKYSSLEDVIKRANNNPYGLASGVFAKDVDVINTLTRSLKAGTCWVNCYNVYDSAMPFGGYKMSGVGRDKGEYAIEHYTQVKAVYQHLPKGPEFPASPWM